MSDRVTLSSRGIYYRQYNGETDLKYIMSLVQSELSEPYVIYTYRYFLQGWPDLSFLAFPESEKRELQEDAQPIGVIVCKQSIHRGKSRRGYIAMLSVDREWRKRGIASNLVKLSIDRMTRMGADEVVLETEVDNTASLGLYSSLGFIREKRLYRFYMNGKDAFRLVLPVIPYSSEESGDESKATLSAPIAVPQPIHMALANASSKLATLETPPSPVYPIHGGRRLSPVISASTSPSFAIGGIIGAASPRSVESNDSFTLYGSHIPSSISPPLPTRPSARSAPPKLLDDDYISGR